MVTNSDVAEVTGLSVYSISKIRNGSRIPSPKVMRRLAHHYGWSLDDQISLAHEDPNSMAYATKFVMVTGLDFHEQHDYTPETATH